MPAVSESRSRTSLFDFFEGKKPKAVGNDISTSSFRAAEETTVVNSTNKDEIATAAVNKDRDEKQPSTADEETAASPSASERALLDCVVDKESHSIRSKTSDNKAETIDTGRLVKSDNAFAAELLIDYPDFHGAGDPVIYDVDPNDDEGVQIDIIVETADTESGDRSTAVTDVVQSVDINGDAAASDDEDESPSSEEHLDPGSVNASGYEDGGVSKDLDDVYESESDDSAVSNSEKGYHNNKNEPINLDIIVDNMSNTEAGVYVSTDSDGSDTTADSEAEESYYNSDFDEDNEPDAEGTDDQLQTEYPQQDSTRSQDQYDPNSEEENVTSEDDSSDMTHYSDLVDFVWVMNNNRQDVTISGMRETFTPFQVINHDDPGEGNRPETDDENRESRAFQTRLNKTDGEGLMNIPLSTSFIMRNKAECIMGGARTVSELMMALQRKRLTEIAQEGREIEMRRTEANLESGSGTFSDGGIRNQADTEEDDEPFIHKEESRSPSLERQQTNNDGNITRAVYEKFSPKPSKRERHGVPKSDTGMAIKGGKGKKTKSKSNKAGLTQTNLGTNTRGFTRQPAGKQEVKHATTTTTARSAAQPRVIEQYPQNNLRKGTKPVLPAISKGNSKSAGQTLPAKKSSRSKMERYSQREQAKNPVGYRKSPIRKSPNVSKFSPRKAALPSIPVQLRSAACFRDGQLEVEVMFDERMSISAEPLEVKVTFVHKHFQPSIIKKPSAYRAKIGKKPNKVLASLSPMNRNIIHQRALWPPFNTHVDPEASERHNKFFGSL